MNVLNVCRKISDTELETRGCTFMEHSLRKITFVGNEEITQPHKRTQMNLLSKFEEYMYFDIYIVAIFKA